MNFISFEEWLERNTDIVNDSKDCPACGGSGDCKCHCGDEHDCGRCDGTGKVGGNTALAIYRAECDKARAMYTPAGA